MGNLSASSISLHSFSLVITALVLFPSFIHGDAVVNRNLMAANDFHTVEVSSLFPNSVCDTSSQGYKLPSSSSLKVVHKHGPCNKQHKTDPPPSPSQILAHNEARVQSINARVVALKNEFTSTEAVTLPAKSGKSLGDGSYIVTVGLGSPKKDLTLAFDTGSNLVWTQCQPCAIKCFKQRDPIFNPAESTSYSNVSCNTAKCNQLRSHGCSGTTCTYEQAYGDKSTSKGNLAKDTLTLSSTETITDFYFGCSQEARGLYGQIAGIIGLGRDPFSLISQTSAKYGNIFSYCLPSTSSGSGYLTLGNAGISNAIQYIPLTNTKELYLINITGIYVGGKKLAISPSVFSLLDLGAVIDSGAEVTQLPSVAYTALRDTFRQQMAMYPMGKPAKTFDTCYDFSSYKGINVPKISIEFGGNKKIDLGITGTLYVVSSSKMCLGFTKTSGLGVDVTILGHTQQKTMQIVYDVAGGRLGFGPNGCA